MLFTMNAYRKYRVPSALLSVSLGLIALLTGPGRLPADKEVLFKATPLTAENSFTAGIEGPACDAQGNCVYEPNYAACNDGMPCTENDTCNAQAQCQGTAKDCSGEDDECNQGLCNASSGICEKSPLSNGTLCGSGEDTECTNRDT